MPVRRVPDEGGTAPAVRALWRASKPPARLPHSVEKPVMQFESWSCPDGKLIDSPRKAAPSECGTRGGGRAAVQREQGHGGNCSLDAAVPRRDHGSGRVSRNLSALLAV